MHIQIPTVLLDGTVLAALSKEDMDKVRIIV